MSPYVARWWEGDVKRKRTFKRKSDRDAFTAERKRRLALGDTPVPTPDITLAEFVEQDYWPLYAVPVLAKLTRASYEQSWEKHHRKKLGSYRLRQLTPIILGNHLNEIQRSGLAASTAQTVTMALSSILTFAVSQERLTHNPLHRVKKPRVQQGREFNPLPPVRVERLRALLAPRDAFIVSLLAYAGPRPHEVWALDVEDVTASHIWIPDATKTGRRQVDLLAPLATDVREHVLRQGIRTGPLIRNANGERIATTWWGNWRRNIFRPAAIKAGLGEKAIPYDLRASFATLLIWEGRTLREVSDQMGNSMAVCEKHYARVFRSFDPAKRTSAAAAIQQARTNPEEATLR